MYVVGVLFQLELKLKCSFLYFRKNIRENVFSLLGKIAYKKLGEFPRNFCEITKILDILFNQDPTPTFRSLENVFFPLIDS
jgi:hypothetical protein